MSINRTDIVAQKTNFLRQQRRVLSQQLEPSEEWLDGSTEAGGLPAKVVADVTREVNRLLKRHSKVAYGDISIREVAEQIDALYWNSAAPPDVQLPDPSDTENDDVVYQGDDLSLDRTIAKLPPTWDVSEAQASSEGGDDDQEAYTAAVTRLNDLSAQRLTLQQKLSTYRTLLQLMKPYRNPSETIQPNLVARDAPLSNDLTKTRTLAIRVAGRIGEKYGQRQASEQTEEDEDAGVLTNDGGKTKLDDILATW